MNIKKSPSINELYVFFHNIESRDVKFSTIFLVGTNNRFPVENFLKCLEVNKLCSSHFINEYFKKYPDKNDINFFDNMINFISETNNFKNLYKDVYKEGMDKLSLAKDCFLYILSAFVKIKFYINLQKSVFFENILGYMTKLGKVEARDIYEDTADVSPIFYTSYKDICDIPTYVKDFTLFMESFDEDVLSETTPGISFAFYKRQEVEELLDSLIDVSDGLEHTLALKLKESLGLNKRE